MFWRGWIRLPGLGLALAASLGAAGSVTLSPTGLAFGKQVKGTTSAAKKVTLTNGLAVALTITGIAVTGDFAQSGGTCPLSPSKVAKGASCTILITFTPTALGARSGQLTVTDSATNSPQTATLSGTGIAPVTVSPTSLTFAKLPLGETSPAQSVTLTNNQSVSLTFTSISASGDFAVASNACGAAIPAFGNCAVGVTFTPKATGTRTGTLSFSDSAANTPQTVSLTGTGSAAALLSIAVTPAAATIFVNGTQQFTATGTYSNKTTKNLSGSAIWTVAPAGAASISAGLATGTAPGNATVTATVSGIGGSAALTVNQVFVPTGSLNTARYYHSATLLDDGQVLVAGGIGPIPGPSGALGELASAELYNPNTGTFTFTGNLNTARDGHSATLLNNGTVLIAGGSGGAGELAAAELYNPASMTFTPTGSLNTARYEHTASMLPNGKVLIAGGYGGGNVLAGAELYNPGSGGFIPTGSLNTARFGATATVLAGGQVLIAGGAGANGALAGAEIYDPVAGTFTPTGSLNTARSGATATLLNTGLVLIADGYNYALTGPLNSAELYDPAAGTFTPTGSLVQTCWLGTATLLTDGTVMMAGGVLGSAAEIYNPFSGTFAAAANLNPSGDLQTATLLPSGALLVAGGHSNTADAVLAAAELYAPPALTPANLVSIALSPANPSLAVGGSQRFLATGTFTDNSRQQLVSVLWSSANPAVATITSDASNSGAAYGVAPGSSMISACAGTVCGATMLTVTSATGAREKH